MAERSDQLLQQPLIHLSTKARFSVLTQILDRLFQTIIELKLIRTTFIFSLCIDPYWLKNMGALSRLFGSKVG
jgi:hypothetical protein